MHSTNLLPAEVINSITDSNHLGQVVDLSKVNEDFKQLARLIHPDLCKLPGANDATAKLFQLKEEFQNGIKYTDESGEFRTNGYWIEYGGNHDLLVKSVTNYNKLISARKTGFNHEHFAKYMPPHYQMAGDMLSVAFDKDVRAVPLTHMTLDQMRVNWILSRLLEFSGLLKQIGYVHVGFTPESVFVCANEHRIYVTSFYHLTPIDNKVTTIAGNYKHWYPTSLFDNKIAETYVDIELSKRLSVCLLGDVSGSGLKLKKTGHAGFINFVTKTHTEILPCFEEYREFLTANFPMKYVPLNNI